MDFPRGEQLRLWSWKLSLTTAILICLLSWVNGVALVWIIVRAALAFLVIYTLVLGSLSLFIKTADPELDKDALDQNFDQGTIIDISLGDGLNLDSEEDYAIPPDSKTGLGRYAGQVDPALVSGVGHQQQADIVRRMGWEEK